MKVLQSLWTVLHKHIAEAQRGKRQKKPKPTQERSFRKETLNNFLVYKAKVNQHLNTECSFSDLKWKKNTPTHREISGVQEIAYNSFDCGGSATMFYAWTPEDEKELLKKQLALSYSATSLKVSNLRKYFHKYWAIRKRHIRSRILIVCDSSGGKSWTKNSRGSA